MPEPVLLLVRELHLGGCERDLTRLAVHLDRKRFRPHVGCFHEQGVCLAPLRTADVPVIRFPVTSFQNCSALAGARQMGRYLREHGIRLVHAFDVPMCAWGVAVAAWYRVPVIISSQLSFRDSRLAAAAQFRLLRWGDRFATHFFVNSEAVRNHMVQDEGIPDSKLFLAHNGVDTRAFHPAGRVENEEAVIIGALCALRPEKQLTLLLEAFARIPIPSARLLIVGSGSELTLLQQRTEQLGITKRTHFEPATSDVPTWLRRMDIFALTSGTESFPNALLEAMACGCAVTAANVGGVNELVADHQTGLLFPAGDAQALADRLTTLASDTLLRRRLGQAAAQHAREQFSAERYAERLASLYTRLLAEKGIPV